MTIHYIFYSLICRLVSSAIHPKHLTLDSYKHANFRTHITDNKEATRTILIGLTNYALSIKLNFEVTMQYLTIFEKGDNRIILYRLEIVMGLTVTVRTS